MKKTTLIRDPEAQAVTPFIVQRRSGQPIDPPFFFLKHAYIS